MILLYTTWFYLPSYNPTPFMYDSTVLHMIVPSFLPPYDPTIKNAILLSITYRYDPRAIWSYCIEPPKLFWFRPRNFKTTQYIWARSTYEVAIWANILISWAITWVLFKIDNNKILKYHFFHFLGVIQRHNKLHDIQSDPFFDFRFWDSFHALVLTRFEL